MDILVVDDRGNLSPAYRNNGDGTFSQTNKQFSINNQGYGMGVAAADFNNDGKIDLLFSNVNFVAKQRYNNSCRENWGVEFLGGDLGAAGLRLLQGGGSGKFTEVTDEAGLVWAGEGLGGVEFVDYNNDGLMDIEVSNGLWTGTDESQDLGSFYNYAFNGVIDKNELDETAQSTVSPIFNILRNFKGDIFSGKPGSARPQLAVHQHKRLFRNLGGGKFLEVGYLENIDSVADGYVVAKADINNDGKMDLVFRNADPGTDDIKFPPVQIFMNQNSEGNNAVRLKLEGTISNRDAIGAEVQAVYHNQKHTHQVLGNNGTVQSEKIVHLGIGKDKKIAALTIHWPSGNIETLKNIEAGFHTIKEGGGELKKGKLSIK